MSRHNKANMPLLSCNDTQGMIALIDQRQSFRVKAEDWEQLWECGQWIEDCLDAADMSSRVYTKGRLAAAAVGMVSFGAGVAVLAGMAAHNLLAVNLGDEICRDFANQQLWVYSQD